jgi:hypothetical protein
MINTCVILQRKPGMSPEEYRTYYEERHARLAAPYVDAETMQFVRIYPKAMYSFPDDWANGEPVQMKAPFDSLTLYTFKDEASFANFMSVIKDPAVSEMLVTDEKNFLDRASCMSGTCIVVRGNGVTSTPAT